MLRIGIIGTGGIADAHISGYLAFADDCEIAALADVIPAGRPRRPRPSGSRMRRRSTIRSR